MKSRATRWFLKCAIGFAVLTSACAIVTAWFGNGLPLPSTTRDANLIVLERYARQATPEVALLGSSLTYRLSEPYFSTQHLRNLALAGGSPVTGLEIVARGSQLPRLILVEANLLSRPIDQDLMEKFSGVSQPLFIRPVRAAVAAYENWLHEPPSHAQMSSALDRLIQGPPSSFDNRVYLERAVRQANAEDPEPVTRENIERVRNLVASIEQRGSKVLLFELPYADEYEATRYAKTTREIVHAAFPDPSRWLTFEVHRKELRWPDGVHLDERSAVLVARSMDRSIQWILDR